MTAPLLERQLVFVTGKGGAGKTTIAAALGLLGADRGRRTIVVEIGGQRRAPALLTASGRLTETDTSADNRGGRKEIRLGERLWSISIDPDSAMIEWLRAVTGRAPARVLSASSTFRYFAAAAPGAKELITMVKLLDLCERYEMVVMDGPASGHALAMLRSPQTFSTIARVGPLAGRSNLVRGLLSDPARSAYVAVAQGSEMAITETLELEDGLRRALDRDLDAVIVNGVLPRRFTREEMARLAKLADEDTAVGTAVAAARAIYRRGRTQQSQIDRLRRQRLSDGAPPHVLPLPLHYSEMNVEILLQMAKRLGRSI
jgi:anion-transporting  ArsA/GET3 family ATPase